MEYWILDEAHNLVPVDDVLTWGQFFEDIEKRRVAETWRGRVWISTVFLGIDHGFGQSPPVLFETMIFHSRRLDGWTDRYHTWDEAVAGHKAAVRLVHTTDVFEAELVYYWNLIPALQSPDKTWRDTLKWLFPIAFKGG